MEAIIGFGGFVGYVGGGYLIDWLGPADLFWALSACIVFLTVFCLVLPESLEEKNKTPKIDWVKTNTLYPLMFFLQKPSADRPRPRYMLILIAIAFILPFLTLLGVASISTLFLNAEPYKWNGSKIGWYNAANTGPRVVAVLFLPFLHRLINSERREMIVSMIALALYAASLGTTPLFHNEIVVDTLSAVGGLMLVLIFGYLRCCLSRSVGAQEQGQMLAAIAFLQNFTNLLSPLIFNNIYSATVNSTPSAVWYVFAGINAVAVACLIFVSPLDDKRGEAMDGEEAPLLKGERERPQHSVNS